MLTGEDDHVFGSIFQLVRTNDSFTHIICFLYCLGTVNFNSMRKLAWGYYVLFITKHLQVP